jgi:hypothetical protein
MTRSRSLVAVAVLVAAIAVPVADAAAPKITYKGVGRVKLGKTFRSLNRAHLIGHLRRGCELSGPNERIALLRAPLKGSVHLTRTRPLRVDQITVTGGAKARGVGIGATIAQIRAKFPKAKVDHTGESVFGLTFVRIPRAGGGRLEFAVDTGTHKTTQIGIPRLSLCE